MSIQSEITRISGNVSDSLDAVSAKGVTVPSGSNSDDLAGLIAQITLSPTLQSKTNISPTTSSQTITADSGYDGLSSVQINAMPSGSAGTPTATKGSVSNHSVSVTPSVTNTAGYISGGTKTGTAVSVSASELVSGNKAITSNGTGIDVKNYATVSVAVSGGFKRVTSYSRSTDGDWIEFSVDSSPSEFHVYLTALSSSPYTPASASPYPMFEIHYDGTAISGYAYRINSRTAIRATAFSGTDLTWSYTSGKLKIVLLVTAIFTAYIDGITLYYK